MRIELTEVQWLDNQHELSLAELSDLSGLTENELRELADFGAIAPIDPDATLLRFHTDYIAVTRTAFRLRNDFELDARGLSLALSLLEQVHDLESQLRRAQARMPHAVNVDPDR